MAIGVDGRIGVVSGGGAIMTIPPLLASFGKSSWYAQFLIGTETYVNADKTGGAVSVGGNIGSVGANPANTSNFTAYFTSSGGVTNQPYLATQSGTNVVVGTGNDVGDTRYLLLNSTTALNGAYSVVVKLPFLSRDARSFYSHNNVQVDMRPAGNTQISIITTSASGTNSDQTIQCVKSSPGTSSGIATFGVTQSGTGHNGFAPYLLRRSTAYSMSKISEVWLMPALTADELCKVVALL